LFVFKIVTTNIQVYFIYNQNHNNLSTSAAVAFHLRPFN
jgi:hypothetical protein